MNGYPWTKETLESFLSDAVGEKVICDEPFPILIKSVSLLHFGIISQAQIYKCADGKIRASLVPFGMTLMQASEKVA